MIIREHLIKILHSPHISEKTSSLIEKGNAVVFKVAKNATKKEIKSAIEKIFSVKIQNINSLIVKGKTKRRKQRICKRSSWKKAYIFLKENQNLDLSKEIR